ncbi:MAG: hypothetical protein HC770_04815 [Pseudanabaena sp. CRU_2_10]|nr:hypothetical protein [Pseudanabaena sp. CRU_2_10]
MALLEFVETPLLLSIMVLSYEKLSLIRWHELTSTKQRIKLLFDAYLQTMFHQELQSRAYGKLKPPRLRQTQQWLSFLAQQLQRESQTEFLIENMQPFRLLTVWQKRLYRLVVGLIEGVILGLTFGLSGGLILGLNVSSGVVSWLIFGMILGLGSGVISGLIFGLAEEIELAESPNWSLKRASEGLVAGLLLGKIGGWVG